MAIGTITAAAQHGGKPDSPLYVDRLSFTGDASYPTGGTLAFEDSVQAVVGDAREILAVIAEDCGGYVPVYDRGADALKVYEEGADGGPADEVTDETNLQAVTFNVVVLSR